MLYKTIAYDPEVGAPRIFAYGETREKATIDCLKLLCIYLQSGPRWLNQNQFELRTTEEK